MTTKTMEELEIVLSDATDMAPSPTTRDVLVRDLSPIAERIAEYVEVSETMSVTCKTDADKAVLICERIAADVKAVQNHDALSKLIGTVHQLHRKMTAFREAFVAPMETARKSIKRAVIDWQEDERRKAEAEQRRLQAEADERARREREALEKRAANLKTEERREAVLAQAASVVAPQVRVDAQKAVKVSRVWTVRAVDSAAFLVAAASDKSLQGYITVETTRLARAKAANPMLEITGVTFEQVAR